MIEGIGLILLGVALIAIPLLADPDGLLMSIGKDPLWFFVIELPTLVAGFIAIVLGIIALN